MSNKLSPSLRAGMPAPPSKKIIHAKKSCCRQQHNLLLYLSMKQKQTTKHIAIATSDQRPATSDQRPATSDQRPATSDQRPATSDQRPAILSYKYPSNVKLFLSLFSRTPSMRLILAGVAVSALADCSCSDFSTKVRDMRGVAENSPVIFRDTHVGQVPDGNRIHLRSEAAGAPAGFPQGCPRRSGTGFTRTRICSITSRRARCPGMGWRMNDKTVSSC